MNNFIYVIIALGILSMLFRKSPLEQNPPNRMPDFGGEGRPRPGGRPPVPGTRPEAGEPSRPGPVSRPPRDPFPDGMEIPPAPRAPMPRPPAPRPSAQTPTVYDTPDAVAASFAAARPTASASASRGVAPIAGSIAADARALTREDLARAVIWAEVLGPPRARRPRRR
ncbi:hypothetical protein ACF3MZ_13050 [Paenibacillaceae bacterium WGS1546]|uniref:hypothetical protein n=1 Tax=Cohnella sp. WGS1546 TaxID=3366810 RepID=UPI00372D77C0